MVHEPIHGQGGQTIALTVGVKTGCVRVHQRGRINQQLKGRRLCAAARAQTHGGCQIAPGAVATHRHPLRVNVQSGGLRHHPMKGCQGVFIGSRKHMLWRQAVIDRKHRTPTGLAQLAAQHIVGFNVANHPATAMKVHQGR